MTKDGLKRAFDISLCILFAPVILLALAVCAVLIKLESPHNVFFKQERLGRKGRPFHVIKLRTMVPNADKMGAGLYTTVNDPRFTRIGIILRRLSLDELPQLYNVIEGNMSIVGPRPLPSVVIQQYPEYYEVILKAKPGITGLSQISGRNALYRGERLKLDMFYAEKWSFCLDIKILFETILVVLLGKGQLNYQSKEDVEGQ